MYVRKVRGQNKVGKIILTPTEILYLKKAEITIEQYVRHSLRIIAKQRRWHWYLNRGKA